jgi:uncharacterized protein
MSAVQVDTNPALLLSRLEDEIRRYDGIVVAFSGGVDSAVLLAAASRALASRAVAFTADSPSMPRSELALAVSIASKLGVEHHVEPTGELENPDYNRNDERRCYFCKQTLFEAAPSPRLAASPTSPTASRPTTSATTARARRPRRSAAFAVRCSTPRSESPRSAPSRSTSGSRSGTSQPLPASRRAFHTGRQ